MKDYFKFLWTLSLQLLMGASLFLFSEGIAQDLATRAEPEAKFYMGRKIAQTMHWQGGAWLIRHKRDQEEAAVKMREFLEIKPGMSVCDFGCGNGYHTFPLAAMVGKEGRVVGVDIQMPFVDAVKRQAAEKNLSQVEVILAKEDHPGLKKEEFDVILLVDVYHELSDPALILQSLKTALKAEGRLVLVEYREEDPDVPIRAEHKMSRPQILKELAANGFVFEKEREELPWQHMMWFRRSSSPELEKR